MIDETKQQEERTTTHKVSVKQILKTTWLALVIAVILPYIAPVIESFFTRDAIANWYSALVKPSWAPPNWLFAPMWFVLYFMIGFSSYLVWLEGHLTNSPQVRTKVRWAAAIYAVQLALNWLWTPLFFIWQLIGIALLEFGILLIAVLLNMTAFYLVKKISPLLLVPYLGWGCYAFGLNFYIYLNN